MFFICDYFNVASIFLVIFYCVTMNALTNLKQDLYNYWQLPHHHNPALAQKLTEVQVWQRARIHRTHAQLLQQPNHQAMARFLIDQLYGGEHFQTLAKQLERIVPKAEKVQRFAPETALETGVLGIQSAIFAVKLDLHLAQYLLVNNLTVDETTMITAYQAVNEKTLRYQQMADLKDVCYRTDKYIKSFMLQKAFALAKPLAYKYDYQPLYDFIAEGFSAMKPIKSIGAFIEPFCQKEITIIDNLHTGKDQPFIV